MGGVKTSSRGEEKQTGRTTSRQVFTCNIKNMNVNMGTKNKDQIGENKSFLVLKKDKTEGALSGKIDKQ